MEDVLGYSAATTESERITASPTAPTTSESGLDRMRRFLAERPESPCLVIDLATVRARYRELAAALPQARLYYAVKANPADAVVRALVEEGASFDVASLPEIELCLRHGATPDRISYGNTIKKHADIAAAYALGVRLFTTDSPGDVEAIARHAPGSSVFCRILLTDTGSVTPFGRKFGCAPELAIELLSTAAERGLRPEGVSFHVGSQQLDPAAWDRGIGTAAMVAGKLAAAGITLGSLNIGGGLPAGYREDAPPLSHYAERIHASLGEHFAGSGLAVPELVMEPGRFLVADAGLLRSEVVLVARKSAHDDTEPRWVYLDIGRYNGLAETENEYIAYRLVTPEHAPDAETGPVYLAGPTCDGDDVIYQRTLYRLPMALRAGDHVEFLSTGAYTASYSSIAFNGFAPLRTYCL